MLYQTRNRPYDGMLNARNGVDRLLHEVTRALDASPAAAHAFQPSLDISENETSWIVRAELPGVDANDVELTVTGNMLSIRGEKKTDTSSEADGVRRTERRYGKFERMLEFPTDLDVSKVAAHTKHGVLTITLPKAEASRPRAIEIKIE